MSSDNQGDWFNRHRMITIGVFLLIVWGSLWLLFFLKADEITKDPCSICAERMGDKVICTMGSTYKISRNFEPNGSIYDTSSGDKPKPTLRNNSIDFSKFNLNNSKP